MQEEKLTFIDRIFIKLPRAINPRYESYVQRKIAELSKKNALDSTKDISPLLLDLFETERTLFGTKLKYSEEFILSAIEELVKSGANIDICINDESPLEMAVRFGSTRIVKALLEKYKATMNYTQYKKLLGMANENHDKAMTDLLVKRYGIPQNKIRNKLGRYLTALRDETPGIYDNVDLIEDLCDRSSGHCCGLSSLWLYLKLLESQPVDADKPRDTLEWFYETQQVLSKWNDGKLSSLTDKEQRDIDRFLQLIVFFQEPDVYLPVGQGYLEQYLEDTKGRKLQKELSIAVKLSCGELGKHLDTILDGRKAVHIVSGDHMVALMRQQDKYIVYNSSSATGVEVVLDSSQKVADWIFEAMGYDKDLQAERSGIYGPEWKYGTNKPYSLVFRGVTFEISQRAYNTKEILAKISSKTKTDRYSAAPHIRAASRDCQASLEYYVEKGVDINARDNYGWTALHSACSKWGSLEIVKHLVQNGADINARDNAGRTALHFACDERNLEIMCYFLEERAKDTNARGNKEYAALSVACLNLACIKGNLETVKHLVETRLVSINAQDNNGYTALHLACMKGNLELVKYLREQGASIDIKNNEGNTALHFACVDGNIAIVKYLKEQRANIDIKNNKGKTALDFAHTKRNSEVVKYFEETKGVEVKNNPSTEGYYASGASHATFFSPGPVKAMPTSSLPHNKTSLKQSLEDFFQVLTSVKLWPSGAHS